MHSNQFQAIPGSQKRVPSQRSAGQGQCRVESGLAGPSVRDQCGASIEAEPKKVRWVLPAKAEKTGAQQQVGSVEGLLGANLGGATDTEAQEE